ncbi:MAG: hypothetical protein GTN99_11275 [Candidatus Dadabacteria bacterium]|nr:hypothetical protein [Candidatus Dadabacteria bacterium]
MKGGLWSDKVWGNYLNHVGTLGLGYGTAWVAGYGEHWTALVCMLAFWLGEKVGVGGYMGSLVGADVDDHEWWQKGVLKENDYLAAVVRGVIWMLPVLPLAWFYPDYMVVVGMPLALLVGAVIARFVPWDSGLKHWEGIEWLTGAVYGAWLWYTLI